MGLLTNMANTCPRFSKTGSLSNIRFPLSHENSRNYQALGTDASDHTMVIRERTLSCQIPFTALQGLGASQVGEPGDGREGKDNSVTGKLHGVGDVGHRVSQLRKAAPLGSWDRLEACHVKQTSSLHRAPPGSEWAAPWKVAREEQLHD